MRLRSAEFVRFWSKVNFSGPFAHRLGRCWEWAGCDGGNGYGKFYLEGKMRWAHRVAYQLEVGPILDGLTLDHLCRNPRCIRPSHLEAVTHQENCQRGLRGALHETGSDVNHHNANKEVCKWGHLFDEANTYIHPVTGRRWCRACARERQRGRRDDSFV